MESVLIITGTMGSGKSTALAEASDLLASRNIAHAAFDLDALGLFHLPLPHLPDDAHRDDWMYRHLRLLCQSYASAGVTRLLLARAIENRAELELCRASVSAKATTVCRLRVSVGVAQHRVQRRESGFRQAQYVSRVAELELILDRAGLEDFTVPSENRSVTDVAGEILARAGWL